MSEFVISELSKEYGSHKAVDAVNFKIPSGSCTALLGPNGAGKTTTLHMLTGVTKPSSGSVTMIDKTGKKHQGDLRRWIGFMPQSPSFHYWMNGSEWLQMMAQLTGSSKRQARIAADEWLEIVGLADAGQRSIGGYSGGMKQRLGLAQAMIAQPELLVLDEPVSALDPIGRREVMALLQSLKRRTTILFSTHVLHDAEDLCDELIILKRGSILMQGQWDTLRKQSTDPLFSIEVEQQPAALAWLHKLGELPFVKAAEIRSTRAELTVQGYDEARDYLLRQIHEQQIPLVSFEAGVNTLEQLFMKAVGS
ncbi:ABC transporter ATP-binding protein [Paenibacillus sp. UMB4589-SE434]|uniref:ABC transporter ATP-binding protein n=1 Tax=Paenibacillus sp. UMB4589-SE434 TaxID=3046314 RepID=UPI00255111D3|nr:ABC transporter ATP-binding protein [Paenibacillus sp. UMB4589-SE434]MDK8181188.1 ABC transporter ATP-binding protein [Paenibacillus sp. UMB4589-SE434]